MQQFQTKLEANLVALVAGWQQVPTCIRFSVRKQDFLKTLRTLFLLKQSISIVLKGTGESTK